MLVYAGTDPESYGIPSHNNYYLIIADLVAGIGHEIYFFFDDYDTFHQASESLELGSWCEFDVVPHSKISFRPSNDSLGVF